MNHSSDVLCVFMKGVTLFTSSFLLRWEGTSHPFADFSCRRGESQPFSHRRKVCVLSRRRSVLYFPPEAYQFCIVPPAYINYLNDHRFSNQ